MQVEPFEVAVQQYLLVYHLHAPLGQFVPAAVGAALVWVLLPAAGP